MNACQDEDDCSTPTRCKHLDRCPNATPAEASTESLVQLGALGVGTGSLPGSEAEALATGWEQLAAIYLSWPKDTPTWREGSALRFCAYQLRQILGRANERQPEENK